MHSPKRCCLSPLPLHFALSTSFMISFVPVHGGGGGPTPLPVPEEMNDIPMVISIMASALERLIRGGKKNLGHLEAAVIDDVLRSVWPANHSSIRPKLKQRPFLCGWKREVVRAERIHLHVVIPHVCTRGKWKWCHRSASTPLSVPSERPTVRLWRKGWNMLE